MKYTNWRLKISQRIRTARQNKGLTQAMLAFRVGKSDRTISAYEIGRTYPQVETLVLLASLLDVPIGYFFGDMEATENKLLYLAELTNKAKDMVNLLEDVLDKENNSNILEDK